MLAASATEGVSVVRATAAAETPSTEVLAASATEGVSVGMETAEKIARFYFYLGFLFFKDNS